MKLFCTVTALMCALVLSGCNKGPCVSDSDCDDSNACTTDQCASGTCAHAAVVVDDGNVCTTDSCDATKGIQRTLVPTDDGNVCTTDYCEPQAGVKHDAIFTGPCAATRLQFRNEPVAASAGQDFVPAVEVVVIDHDGIVVSSAVGSVSMVLAANGSSAVLAGTQTQPLVNGIAHFADLHVDTQALQVALVASPTGVESGSVILPVTSDPFNVLAPCPAGEVRNAAEGCVSYCDSSVPNPCISPPASTCTGGSSPIATNYQSPGTCAVEGTSPYYTCSSYPSSSTTCTGSTTCQSGTIVVTNSPMCSVANGTASCSVSTSMTDCSLTSQVCSSGACVNPPVLTAASPGGSGSTVAAHGARLTLTGTHLIGTTSVTIGGVAHNSSNATLVVSDTTVTVSPILDTVPVGSQAVTVTNSIGTSASISVTVANLVISEIDTIQTTTGNPRQFVELSVGSTVGSVSLSGYVLVLFDGSSNASYFTIDLAGAPAVTTNANGYLIVGTNTAAPPSADIVEFDPNATPAQTQLMTGTDAVGLYQGTLAAFPGGTQVTESDLIDAVVYSGSQNPFNTVLQNTLLLSGGKVNENTHGNATTESLQRSSANSARRADDAFTTACVTTPTPRGACPN